MENVTVKVVNMTPDMAAELLKKNTSNRAISKVNVRRIKKAIMDGQWCLNNDAITIANDGTITNGQHRLTAIAQSGETVPVLLLSGVPRDTFMYCDRGKTRTAADALSVKKAEYYVVIACIIKREYILNTNGKNSQSWFEDSYRRGSGVRLEPYEVVEMYERRKPMYDRLAQITDHLYRQSSFLLKKPDIGGIAAFLINTKKYDYEFVIKFFKQICGVSEIKMNVIRLLQKRLRDDQIGISRLTAAERLQYIAKTWNYYRRGYDVKALRLHENDLDEFFNYDPTLFDK